MARVLKPNNDLRPLFDTAGNALPNGTGDERVQGKNNVEASYYSPDSEGYMTVVKDCDRHFIDIPAKEVGYTLPHCDECHLGAFRDRLSGH
jgi:hypothetical protein